jgi:hypothetical protein
MVNRGSGPELSSAKSVKGRSVVKALGNCRCKSQLYRWQSSTGEWCCLAPDDIVALRALKAARPLHSEEQK